MYPQYSFQNSILIIDQLTKSESLVKNGLLSYAANFEFCPADYDLALQSISKNKPDLMVISLDFEKGSSLDFAKELQKRYFSTPSIFLSEAHLFEIQQTVLKLGAFDLIQHPDGHPAELIRRIDRAVRVTRKLKTRAESFVELHEQSRTQGKVIAELLEEKNEFPLV
jgi:DNA-binding NtrC family response regulator